MGIMITIFVGIVITVFIMIGFGVQRGSEFSGTVSYTKAQTHATGRPIRNSRGRGRSQPRPQRGRGRGGSTPQGTTGGEPWFGGQGGLAAAPYIIYPIRPDMVFQSSGVALEWSM